jgi:hypothetical protein
MCQHAAAGEGVQHLRGVRAHPGSGPSCQDEDRRFAVRCQENLLAAGRSLPPACISMCRHPSSVSLSARSRQRRCTAPSVAHRENIRVRSSAPGLATNDPRGQWWTDDEPCRPANRQGRRLSSCLLWCCWSGSPFPRWAVLQDGTIVFANMAFAEMVGCEAEEVVVLKFHDVFHTAMKRNRCSLLSMAWRTWSSS